MPSLKAMAREAQKKPKAGPPKQALSRKQTVFKSTERVADSDLESETESESGSDSEDGSTIALAPVAKLNGQTPKPVAASIEVDSDENDDEEVESENQVDAVVSSDRDSTSAQSGTESESESNKGSYIESEPDNEQGYGKARGAAGKSSSHLEEDNQAKSDKRRSIPTYNPPEGFTILSEHTDGKQKVIEVFGRSNIAGKQLWYITAPASVPISAVTKVSLQDVQLGKAVLSFGGHGYGFVQEQNGEMDSTKVLIPDGSSNAYRTGQKAVDQILHLQQIVQLHKVTKNGSLDSKVSANIIKKPVRKQPDGLQMRFRPIGFGHGETGTIGLSSSSSDASSSTDTDADEEMEDAPPVSRQILDLDQANTRLSEHASKASESEDDTSSSGEETDGPPIAAPVDSQSDSDSSLDTSDDDMEELPKSMSAPKKSSSSPTRALKRKLSDFKKDERTSNTLHEQFKANGILLKTTNLRKSGPALAGLVTKVNGTANIIEQKFPSTSPSKITQDPPPRGSEIVSSHVDSSKPKMTPILPLRKSSILPPGRGSKSPDFTRVVEAAGARPDTFPVKSAGTPLPVKKNTQSLEDQLQSIDPALGEKERKKETRRLKKNDASRISKNQRTEPMNSATSDSIVRSINASSPSRNDRRHVFKARSPTTPMANKDLSQVSQPNLLTSVEKAFKKPKKHTSNTTSRNENIEIPRQSQEASKMIPLPGKESVILPPKFARSISS